MAFGFGRSAVLTALQLCGAVPSAASGISGSASVTDSKQAANPHKASPAPAQYTAQALELLLACDGSATDAAVRKVYEQQSKARAEQRAREDALSVAFVKRDHEKEVSEKKSKLAAQDKAATAEIKRCLANDLNVNSVLCVVWGSLCRSALLTICCVQAGKPLTLEQHNFLLAPDTHVEGNHYPLPFRPCSVLHRYVLSAVGWQVRRTRVRCALAMRRSIVWCFSTASISCAKHAVSDDVTPSLCLRCT